MSSGSLLEVPLYRLNPALARFGDLNLVGLLNPLRSIVPKRLLYGQVADWSRHANPLEHVDDVARSAVTS